MFIFSLVCHEAAHAFVGFKQGDDTAFRSGQITLNPIPHIRRELFGTVIVPILSFLMGGWMMGWGSAPYDPRWAYAHPKRAAKMALAGPSANLALMLLSVLIIHLGVAAHIFYPPESISFIRITSAHSEGIASNIAGLLSIFFSLNLILFIFNLFPLPPLDGSSILALFMSDEDARKYLTIIGSPAYQWIGLFVAWRLFMWFYPPIHLFVINMLYPGVHYG